MNMSDLLLYSSEHDNMKNNFDGIYSKEEAALHPILKDYDLEDFYFRTLISPNDIEDYVFFSSSRDLGKCEIPKRRIVGTTHPDYKGKTWLEMLTVHTGLVCKTYAEISKIIPFEKQEPKIHLLKYRNQYVISKGISRICQAQFVDTIDKIPCLVTEFIFDQIGYDRYMSLFSVGAQFTYRNSYEEGDIVTAGYDDITLCFSYTEEGVDRCFSVLLMADAIKNKPIRCFFFNLLHRKTNQKKFNLDQRDECKKAIRAAIDRMQRPNQ